MFFFHTVILPISQRDVLERCGKCVAKVPNVSDESTNTLRTVPDFRFLTNYGNTLLLIARDPRLRIREIAALLDIPERTAQRIVSDLAKTGYIDSERQGRRNVYSVRNDQPFNLPFQRDVDIKALLGILAHMNEPETPTDS